MNNKFDELAKGLTQSMTRRQAFRKFGLGLAGMALACFGVTNKASAWDFNACMKSCKNTGFSNSYCNWVCKGGKP